MQKARNDAATAYALHERLFTSNTGGYTLTPGKRMGPLSRSCTWSKQEPCTKPDRPFTPSTLGRDRIESAALPRCSAVSAAPSVSVPRSATAKMSQPRRASTAAPRQTARWSSDNEPAKKRTHRLRSRSKTTAPVGFRPLEKNRRRRPRRKGPRRGVRQPLRTTKTSSPTAAGPSGNKSNASTQSFEPATSRNGASSCAAAARNMRHT